MAEALSERVPTVHTGMLIADAIEEVLRQQELTWWDDDFDGWRG